jgi:predicted transcriptional regulator of viral defense system
MGKVKYIQDIREFFKKSPVVDIGSLKRFMVKENKDYIYLIINNLLKKKEINQITKGFYSIHEDPSLIVSCFKPAYLGLQNAMSFHNLWEQETNPVVITTRHLRKGIRKVFDRNILIRRIDKKYMFGFEFYLDGDFYFPYSDVEKTFIDMVYFKQHMDKEVIDNFLEKINKKKLNIYLKKYPVRFRNMVFKLIR